MASDASGSPSATASPHGTVRIALDILRALDLAGPSPLAFWYVVATRASDLCDGRRIRVAFPGIGAHSNSNSLRAGPPTPGDWVAVLGTGVPERQEARLSVEPRGRDDSLPCLDDVSALARWAGLASERYTLQRELRRARREAPVHRADLAHQLRGDLNATLLRTDALQLALRNGSADASRIEEDLASLRKSVLHMTGRIRDLLEAPDPGARRHAPSRAEAGELVRVDELLRAGRDAVGFPATGDLTLDLEFDIPRVRADGHRLQQALAELPDLARRSGGTATLVVGRQTYPECVRITLRLSSPLLPGIDPGPTLPEAESRASILEVVDEVGGRVWIETEVGAGAEVVVLLPAADLRSLPSVP